MRYLAIDYGTKRSGLAISDATETIASPLTVITTKSRKQLLEKIAETIDAEDVKAVVLGLPLNMDGSKGPQAALVFDFAEQLKKKVDMPVYLQDERLTSFAAEKKLAPAGFIGKKKKNKHLDAIAAAEILRNFLDTKNTDTVEK